MAYYSVEDAVNNFVDRYGDIKIAISKSQVQKALAKTEDRFKFWSEVEAALKTRLPKKKKKWEQ